MKEYFGDLSVRQAQNGVVVSQQAGAAGAMSREFVFTAPDDLAKWMAIWYADILTDEINEQ